MSFDAKLFAALIFIALSLATLFAVRSRTNTIATLIIAHLCFILFLSLTITNYNSFKEIVLTLIAYLMMVLFLITNNNADIDTLLPPSDSKPSWAVIIFGSAFAFIVFCGILYLTNISLKSVKPIETALREQLVDEIQPPVLTIDERKKLRLSKKLHDNFLLKRSSDVILIIVATTSGLLLLRRRRNNVESFNLAEKI